MPIILAIHMIYSVCGTEIVPLQFTINSNSESDSLIVASSRTGNIGGWIDLKLPMTLC